MNSGVERIALTAASSRITNRHLLSELTSLTSVARPHCLHHLSPHASTTPPPHDLVGRHNNAEEASSAVAARPCASLTTCPVPTVFILPEKRCRSRARSWYVLDQTESKMRVLANTIKMARRSPSRLDLPSSKLARKLASPSLDIATTRSSVSAHTPIITKSKQADELLSDCR